MNGLPALDDAVTTRPPVLLVDDEVAILDGLRRQLRKKFTVYTANGGAEALRLLESEPVTVVVSDMRMPEMDGATFLSHVRRRNPEIVRILLTGQADTQATMAAVSEGQIYRFLTKPCPPEVLVAELDSAIEFHRLVTADEELLRTTLRRSVESLTATLPRDQPALLARAVRINRIVSELVQVLEVDEPWEIELTSMLAHLGAVTLPPAVLAKLEAGRPLNEDEREMDNRVIGLSRDLVAAYPRMERVAEGIGLQRVRYDGAGSPPGTPSGGNLPLGARILRLAVDFDAGMTGRGSVQDTISVLRADAGAYDPEVLDALVRCHAPAEPGPPRTGARSRPPRT
jgi:response regulator RpfG family c-di-GMP phosphodiesterase